MKSIATIHNSQYPHVTVLECIAIINYCRKPFACLRSNMQRYNDLDLIKSCNFSPHISDSCDILGNFLAFSCVSINHTEKKKWS